MQGSSITTSTGTSVQSPVVFVIQVPDDAFVLNATAPARRILPVPIQPSFPHITLQLGQVLGCSKCLSIRCIVDTAAALNTSNLHYYAAIAWSYPHTGAAIFSAADNNPIVLSGIVQQGGASVTTDLTVAFQFHMPYLTREGHPTTPNVTVNTILSLPFIQGTRMILDASDQVAELRALDTPPFALNFCRAMCTIPPVSGLTDECIVARYASIINMVDRIEAMYSSTTNVGPSTPQPASIFCSPKHSNGVAFDSAFADDGSIISIGSAIDPKINDDTDVLCLLDVYSSA